MIKRYRVPIQGTVVNREPLTGDKNDPIVVFPISELPDKPDMTYSYTCLEYNIDEGWCEIELDADEIVHDWLTAKQKDIPALMAEKHLELKCAPESPSTV